jgi:hypothetical protein
MLRCSYSNPGFSGLRLHRFVVVDRLTAVMIESMGAIGGARFDLDLLV